MKRVILSSFLLISALISLPAAQMRVVPLDDAQGHVALGLALRHLSNVGIFMHTTAHPDDENNALLVMLNRGQGYRTALATATRGNGGQNEIGPEIFEALGVLRTGELAALHRFDGAEQYFTRAVDFGYSFGIDETFEKWGREEITADYVRLIRMVRPDVVIALPPTGNAGGQHHMASSVITHDAVKLAGDATKFPEQIANGLRPWQPKKFYQSAGFGFPGEPETPGPLTRVNSSIYDPLLGKTYTEIGIEARSMHKCQGMGQLLALPGTTGTATYRLVESTLPPQADEKSLFEGIDTSIASLAKFAGARPSKDLTDGLAAISAAVQASQKAFDTQTDDAVLQPLLSGLHAVRALRSQLRGMNIADAGKFEIEFRLRQKEGEFQKAALLANGVRVEVLADDGVVVPGQPVKVHVIVANHGAADVSVKQVKISGFEGDAACAMTAFTASPFGFPIGRGGPAAPTPALSTLRKDQAAHCEPSLTIPANARITEPYWQRKDFGGRYTFDADAPFGLPFRPTPFYVQVTLALRGGEEIIDGLPVQYRYQGNIFSGEKRTDLLVVPALSVRVSPAVAIVPADAVRPAPTAARSTPANHARPPARPSATREIRVTVVNDTNGPKTSTVRLKLPAGWTATPPQQQVAFARGDESLTVRFEVKPAASAAPGEYHVHAVAVSGGESFDRGYEVIEYPHIGRYHIYDASDTTLKILNVKTTPNLLVGYVMGVGDQVPSAIEQLGAKVEMIGADDLAWGDLSRFDVIVTGVRAYERRDDLRANNARLLDYVKNGGTMIVQYNKFEFNDAQYGPYPAKVSANRITDEGAPVKVLEPENKVFTQPNRIQPSAWNGWVQERGLYFLGDKDARYKDLLQMEDQFPYNRGVKAGSLVEATYGKGKWLYVGLNFWRQLPEGTDGAYQLFANLLSLGKPSTAVVPAIKGR
jgi:LmbE family N-acetylglucosaminyl deacetylase